MQTLNIFEIIFFVVCVVMGYGYYRIVTREKHIQELWENSLKQARKDTKRKEDDKL